MKIFNLKVLPTCRNNATRSLVLFAGLCVATIGSQASEHVDADNLHNQMGNNHSMDHGHHMKMMESKDGYQVSRIKNNFPDTRLVGADGKSTSLQEVLRYPGGVMMNFVFTSCTTICPAMSVIFSGVDNMLANNAPPVLLVSISIDPEHDTPARLKKYAAGFHAGKNWLFFTGELNDIIELQKALKIYRGNKMNHSPATFIHHNGDADWLYVDGFAAARDLVREYKHLGTGK